MEVIPQIAIWWTVFGFLSFVLECSVLGGLRCGPDRQERIKRIARLQLGGPISCVVVMWRALRS